MYEDKPITFVDTFAFVLEVVKATDGKPWGKPVKFTCPFCNGKAKAVRSIENGNIRASCAECKMKVIE